MSVKKQKCYVVPANHRLCEVPLYWPNAINWMWDQAIFMGSYKDKHGDEYDLGVIKNSEGTVLIAVAGNRFGNYDSFNAIEGVSDCRDECIKRAKALGFIK